MFGSRSAYKFAAKLSPAQRDHQQGQVLYQREAKKKNAQTLLAQSQQKALFWTHLSDRSASKATIYVQSEA